MYIICVCVSACVIYRFMMVTTAVPQSWLGCVAARHPAASTLPEMSFISSSALTAASTLEASLHHTLPVWKHIYTCTWSNQIWSLKCNIVVRHCASFRIQTLIMLKEIGLRIFWKAKSYLSKSTVAWKYHIFQYK